MLQKFVYIKFIIFVCVIVQAKRKIGRNKTSGKKADFLEKKEKKNGQEKLSPTNVTTMTNVTSF